jgi:ABC-2 type transport system ATP-binding protein
MNLAIETDNLGKRYGNVTAVERLSIRVAEGEIYAFLGLNGAGKTTTMRMLLGMIKPTTGRAKVLGTLITRGSRKPWASVGYMVESPRSYPELTVRENLEVARRLHPGTPQAAVTRFIECLRLDEYADRRAGTLSQGNAQRLGLAKALLHDPSLLLLDEPANGLDPAGIVEIRELLLDLTRKRGVTIFMSSHILAEVSRLAQRIGIIHQARLLQELSLDELERNRQRWLSVRTRDAKSAYTSLISAGKAASMRDDGSIELTDKSSVQNPDEISQLLVHAGTPPIELVVVEEGLEKYFLRLVGMEGVRQ